MIVPFSVSDFIDRAVQVYGARTGVRGPAGAARGSRWAVAS